MEMPSTFTCISPLPFFSMSLLLLLLLPPLAVSLLLCCLGVAVVIRRGRAVTEVSVKEQAFQCPHCTLFQPNFSSSPYLSSPFNFPHRKRQFIIHRMSTVLIELTVDIKKKKKHWSHQLSTALFSSVPSSNYRSTGMVFLTHCCLLLHQLDSKIGIIIANILDILSAFRSARLDLLLEWFFNRKSSTVWGPRWSSLVT